ncbi:MAG: DUF5678 domain-containing protein [Methanosarcinales archaeon]
MIELDDNLKNLEWRREHHSELAEKYPNMWVAIVDKKVVASHKRLGIVEVLAEKRTGIDRNKVTVSFIEGNNLIV